MQDHRAELELGGWAHAAHARLSLCALLVGAGDAIGAELELTAAVSVFASVDAHAMLGRCRELRGSLVPEQATTNDFLDTQRVASESSAVGPGADE